VTLEFVKAMLAAFKDEQLIHRRYAFEIILQAQAILKALPALVDVEVPAGGEITVCGDTHGQFYDLLRIFDLNGLPSEANPYLFNGDFVDRGSWSVEIILTLLAFKCLYPQHMHLTRGNHEAKSMNTIYGAPLNQPARSRCCRCCGRLLRGLAHRVRYARSRPRPMLLLPAHALEPPNR
jgi:serine/threonine-protein phosphatase 5